MANDFTQQEVIAFDKMCENFEDALVMAKMATRFDPASKQEAVRSRDQFWIPEPQISFANDGSDATGNFGEVTDRNVPVNVSYWKHDAKQFSATDLRSQYTVDNWMDAAKNNLASEVNSTVYSTVALQGGVFSKRTAAATGYDDVAELDASFSEIGVPMADRCAVYSPRDMNKMAGNLAERQTDNNRDRDAYSKALVGTDIAGFEVYKNDQTIRKTAAAGGVTTVNGANQRTVPSATMASGTDVVNKDNRYTDLVVTSANYAGIEVGDAFTIAGVNALHLISKENSDQLKTFRVIAKPAANTIRIYPAIVDAAEGSDASKAYANVDAGPANGAALTWLNTTSAAINPFFKKKSLLIIPGTFEIEDGAGVSHMTYTTEMGITLHYTKQTDIDTLNAKCRFDLRWGTALISPEMAGAQMFGQA